MKRWTALERETANLVRISNRKVNQFRTNYNNNSKHEVAKLLLYLKYRRQGRELIVEAEFEQGGRADILDLTNGTAIEITNTEKEKSIEAKRAIYPVYLDHVNADKIIRDWLKTIKLR